MVLNLDLNFPPVESWLLEGTSNSIDSWITLGTAVPVNPQCDHPTRQQSMQSSSGLFGSPIDVEAIEDDVQMLASSRAFPQARNQSRRNNPVTIVLDEDLEMNPRLPGFTIEETRTTFSLNSHKRERICTNRRFIDFEALFNLENYNAKRKTVMRSSHPEPLKEPTPPPPPKEPTFTCPVCMNPLVEPSSTICGHIFCQGCIKASIQAQKRCPACRRKLNKNNFHRIYLPSATAN